MNLDGYSVIYGQANADLRAVYDTLLESGLVALTASGTLVVTPEGAIYANDVLAPWLEEHGLMQRDFKGSSVQWAVMAARELVAAQRIAFDFQGASIYLYLVVRQGTQQRDRADFGRTIGRRKIRA